MPTNRRHRQRQRRGLADLSPDQRRELLTGRAYVERFADLDTMREAWQRNRDNLRDEWSRSNPPGTRCLAKWLFEIVPQFGERRTTRFWRREHEQHRANWETFGILHTHLFPAVQESEAEYLDRTGLLTDEERELFGEIVPVEQEHRDRLGLLGEAILAGWSWQEYQARKAEVE